MGFAGYKEDIDDRYFNSTTSFETSFGWESRYVIPSSSIKKELVPEEINTEIENILKEYKILIELTRKHQVAQEDSPGHEVFFKKIALINEISSAKNFYEIEKILEKRADEYINFKDRSEIIYLGSSGFAVHDLYAF